MNRLRPRWRLVFGAETLGNHPLIQGARQLAYWLMPALALAGSVGLLLRHGFHLSAADSRLVDSVLALVLDGFIFLFGLRLLLSADRLGFIRARRVDAVLVVLLLVALPFPDVVGGLFRWFDPRLNAESVAALYLTFTQGAVFVSFIPALVRASKRILRLNIQASTILVGSFLALVMAGTFLLMLPKATEAPGISFLDALFMSTSSVCVTGLVVVDTATQFTPLGLWILLILMQAGGLGIMTLTTIVGLFLGGGGNLKEYATVQSLLGEESIAAIRRTLFTIVAVTILSEGVGAALLYQSIPATIVATERERIFFAVFHAVSAFCNAGFTLTSDNLAHPDLSSNVPFLSIIMILVIIGGLGFPVVTGIGRAVWRTVRNLPGSRSIPLHARIVLVVSALLIFGGAAAIGIARSDEQSLFSSLFLSVVSRTAGFNTDDIGALSLPALLVVAGLMWVGGSPASTAGGVKTTSVALAVLNLRAIVTGRQQAEVFRRSIDRPSIVRAFSTILLSFGFIFILTLALSVTDAFPLERALFEVVSAVSTVGLSTGITSSLSDGGKMTIIVGMFIGRVGFLSFVMALVRRSPVRRFEYQSERILVI